MEIERKSQNLALKPYDGANLLVPQLSHFIASGYEQLFVAIIAHGSIGSKDEIRYSDFDGLLIIKDSEWKNPMLDTFMRTSQRLILRYDPLQHHGWFKVKESDLKAYPEDYLPLVVLQSSKLIWPQQNTSINVQFKTSYDFQKGFNNLSSELLSKVNRQWVPGNMYQLKSFLSEIMLLPCLFITALNGVPIQKGLSFQEAEERFPEFEWHAMQTASKIRQQWYYQLNPLQKVIMKQPGRFWRKLTEKKVAPAINREFSDQLGERFYGQLRELIQQMKKAVKP